MSGVTRNYVARLNTDGTLDSSFDPNPNNAVYALGVQADGKILIGGIFTDVGGVTRNRIARLNPNGTLDISFNPNASNGVYTLVIQADGKILIGGIFSTIGEVIIFCMARLNTDGTLDNSLNTSTAGSVFSLALQADGNILMGASLSTVSGTTRRGIARLSNNISADSSIFVTGTSQIYWARGGSTPEVEQVSFDNWNGASWVNLGLATRVTGGWRLTGLILPSNGWVRARGRTSSGRYTGSSGLVEKVVGYGGSLLDITVTVDGGSSLTHGTDLVDGIAALAFGSSDVGTLITKTVTVYNNGTSDLTGLTVSRSGTNASEFAVGVLGSTTLPPGASTTFTVSFTPTAAGARSATLQIASNNTDENPFNFTLGGTGVAVNPIDITFDLFAGTYQGILVNSPAGDPVGKIDFTVSSTGALSGALLLKGQKSFSFKSSLTNNEIDDTADLTNFDIVKPKEGFELKLSLKIAHDGSFTVNGDALLPTLTTEFVEAEDSTARLGLFDYCPWAGTYTMAFPYVSNNHDDATPPGGTSIGTATVNYDGVMTAKGTLADGTKFSFSARASEDGTYRVFISPYKSAGCFYTMFRLTQQDDYRYLVDEGDGMAGWSKSANPKDKSYRDGFDVNLDAVVVQWSPPNSYETLRDLLGLGSDNILDIDFFSGLSPSTYADFLPTSLGLNLNNTFRIASADGETPITDEAAWSKIFSSKIDPKTGRITFTINISDLVEGKTIKRKVVVNGVLMQVESDLLDQPYAFGHLLVPPLDKKNGILTSGGFDLTLGSPP